MQGQGGRVSSCLLSLKRIGVVLNFQGLEGLQSLHLCRIWSHSLHCKYSAIKGDLGLSYGTLIAIED